MQMPKWRLEAQDKIRRVSRRSCCRLLVDCSKHHLQLRSLATICGFELWVRSSMSSLSVLKPWIYQDEDGQSAWILDERVSGLLTVSTADLALPAYHYTCTLPGPFYMECRNWIDRSLWQPFLSRTEKQLIISLCPLLPVTSTTPTLILNFRQTSQARPRVASERTREEAGGIENVENMIVGYLICRGNSEEMEAMPFNRCKD